jgi:hypothetical protein
MSQADFIRRWCIGTVLARVSSTAAGSAAVEVHVPPMTAVTVPDRLCHFRGLVFYWPFAWYCL